MKDAIKVLLRKAGPLLPAGCAYFLFGSVTGWWIPCLFHLLTGLYCPGCGMTRMILSLARLDFKQAARCNLLAFLTLPVLGVLLLRLAARYVKTGSWKLSRRQNRLVWALAVSFLLFGILRNLPAFAILAPPAE